MFSSLIINVKNKRIKEKRPPTMFCYRLIIQYSVSLEIKDNLLLEVHYLHLDKTPTVQKIITNYLCEHILHCKTFECHLYSYIFNLETHFSKSTFTLFFFFSFYFFEKYLKQLQNKRTKLKMHLYI